MFRFSGVANFLPIFPERKEEENIRNHQENLGKKNRVAKESQKKIFRLMNFTFSHRCQLLVVSQQIWTS